MIKKAIFLLFFSTISFSQQVNPSFGNNGAIITDYALSFDNFGDLLVLPDGKIVLFGNSYVATDQNQNGFAIIKYNLDGSLDNTFGIKGKVILNFDSYQNSIPTSAIIQSDGKILIAGSTANQMKSAITRLLANGAIDVDFGFNGKMILESKEINKVLLTTDQKIIVLGKTTTDFSVEKLNNDGFYDTTFGNNGITTIDDNNDFETFISGQIMSDGSLLCVGNSSNPNFQANKVVFIKFSSDGILDANFSIKRINMPNNSNEINQNFYVRDFKVLSDNSMILLVDGSYMTSQNFADSRIYKVDMNGNLITSFGVNGYYQINRCLGCETRLQNLQILDNQKFIVALYGETSSGSHYISNSLYNHDGSLNTNFGVVSIGLGSDFANIAKTEVVDNKLYTAYNRSDSHADYYINSFLIDNQFLFSTNFENDLATVSMYPNPFKDKITVEFENKDIQNIKITVFNINGSKIYSKNDNEVSKNKSITINELSNFATGIYFMKLETENFSKTVKLIKQ